jgi:hypothetical protein
MYLEVFQLNGKNALVTGSRRGLGAVIAVALAEAGVSSRLNGKPRVPLFGPGSSGKRKRRR